MSGADSRRQLTPLSAESADQSRLSADSVLTLTVNVQLASPSSNCDVIRTLAETGYFCQFLGTTMRSVLQCTMCTLDSFFSYRPSAVRHILKSYYRHTIQHIFVPTRSVERNIEKIWFLWASNSKFVIFPQIFPCSNYKICPIIPLLFPGSNGDSPVVTTFPSSNYRGFFTTGESYCPMYTLCTVRWSIPHPSLLSKPIHSIQSHLYKAPCCYNATSIDDPRKSHLPPLAQILNPNTKESFLSEMPLF